MFKVSLLIGSLLMGILATSVEVHAASINPSATLQQAIAGGIDYSRETETCINLRGCGRRDRT